MMITLVYILAITFTSFTYSNVSSCKGMASGTGQVEKGEIAISFLSIPWEFSWTKKMNSTLFSLYKLNWISPYVVCTLHWVGKLLACFFFTEKEKTEGMNRKEIKESELLLQRVGILFTLCKWVKSHARRKKKSCSFSAKENTNSCILAFT